MSGRGGVTVSGKWDYSEWKGLGYSEWKGWGYSDRSAMMPFFAMSRPLLDLQKLKQVVNIEPAMDQEYHSC